VKKPFHPTDCLAGRKLQGKAIMTIVGNRIVMKDGKIIENI